MELEIGSRRGRGAAPVEATALRLLVLADLGGDRAIELGRRPLVRGVAESFDDAVAAVAPRLSLPAGDPDAPSSFEPRRLEDFHPDELYRQLHGFAGLTELRRRLLDPKSFAQTAAALEKSTGAGAVMEDDAGTLQRLLGARRPADAPSPARASLDRLIADIVAPHVTPDIASRQKPLVAAVEQALGQHMRGVLQHPEYRRLEASWRSVHRLVASIESDADIDIAVFLLDVAGADLVPEALARRLEDPAPGGRPWSLVVLDQSFGPADAELLGTLGGLAAQAGAPLLAGADPALFGCRSFAETPDPRDWSLTPEDAARWQALRASPAAAWIGLAAPRWLLRLPYGSKSESIEAFPFEELEGGREHERYLWGNGAFAIAQLVAAGFAQGEAVLGIDDLPAHTYRQDGETHLQACAEAFLPDRALEAMLARGVMPLASARDRNAVRVLRLQSLADPHTPLAVERP
jgi:type VI secretion system protein ImpC